MKKKGISPLIATVLLIGLTISIALLAILWGKNYIEELAEKRGLLAEKQQQCNNVEITSVKAECTGGNCTIALKNKRETKINKLVFRITGQEKGGASESSEALNALEVKQYNPQFIEDEIRDAKSIDVIPHLRVAPGHYIPCSQQSIKVKVA
ncbi:MAG: hypothetical protein Q8O03_05580 [Nanoarchaeota archaeon]|nr:hypothetical protein [Nanoarchaeota archaeon]